MAHSKQYIDANVYDEAKRRLHHIYDSFDSVCVSFSGGKDSLVLLHMNDEVRSERGITDKAIVLHRDPEIIPDPVVEFVQNYYNSGKYDFRYIVVPAKANQFIMGKHYEYIRWDKRREWIRQPPEGSIFGDGRKYYTPEEQEVLGTGDLKGRIAIMTGVRSDESLFRLRASLNKINENYINAAKFPNTKVCKPLFDWSQADVFKYLYDNKIPYCSIYDDLMWNNETLRVSPPLHAEASKRFDKARTLYPVFYQQIVDAFPQMILQELYWKDFSKDGILQRYPKSWNGITKYIKETVIDEDDKRTAINSVFEAKTYKYNRFKQIEYPINCGGYPLRYVFLQIISGTYKKGIMPMSKITQEDIRYEKESEDFKLYKDGKITLTDSNAKV